MKYFLLLTLLLIGCTPAPDNALTFDATKIPPGTSLDFSYHGEEAILVNENGNIRAYKKSCPVHEEFSISYEDDQFECPHGTFDAEGNAKSGLPKRTELDLHEIPVKREGNNIIIQ